MKALIVDEQPDKVKDTYQDLKFKYSGLEEKKRKKRNLNPDDVAVKYD